VLRVEDVEVEPEESERLDEAGSASGDRRPWTASRDFSFSFSGSGVIGILSGRPQAGTVGDPCKENPA